MSTLPEPQPPSPNLPPFTLNAEDVLAFVREENQRHRDFFGDLFNRTASVLTILIAAISIAAGVVGWKTIGSAKESAESAARSAVEERLGQLRPQIDQQINAAVTSEFATPKIDELVEQAARQATATTANKIIRNEVHDQVAEAVASEQGTIDRTLTTATESAVSSVQGSIKQHVDQAVIKVVDDRIDPELRRLRAFSDLSSAVALARSGDGGGFDRLVLMESQDSFPEVQRAAKATVDSISGLMMHGDSYALGGVECQSGPTRAKPYLSVTAYVSQLANSSAYERMQAVYCLGRPDDLVNFAGQSKQNVKSALDALFQSMSDDPDLNVRKAAYNAFVLIAGWVHDKEAVGAEVHMFDNAANAKWWKENRRRFVET